MVIDNNNEKDFKFLQHFVTIHVRVYRFGHHVGQNGPEEPKEETNYLKGCLALVNLAFQAILSTRSRTGEQWRCGPGHVSPPSEAKTVGAKGATTLLLGARSLLKVNILKQTTALRKGAYFNLSLCGVSEML